MYNISSLIWGMFLLLFGISLIFQSITGISLPLARIFAGVFLVYLGYNLMFKNICWWDKQYYYSHQTCTKKRTQNCFTTDEKAYSVSFSAANIDLSRRNFEPGIIYTIRSSTSFGSTIIKVPQNVIIELAINANFAHVILPDGSKMTTGNQILRPTNNELQLPILQLSIDVFCGEVIITT